MRASICVAGGWKTRQTAGSVALVATACANHRVERAVVSQSTPSANTNRVEGGRGNRRSGFNNASAVRQRGGCSPSDRRFRSAVDRSVTLMLQQVRHNYAMVYDYLQAILCVGPCTRAVDAWRYHSKQSRQQWRGTTLSPVSVVRFIATLF